MKKYEIYIWETRDKHGIKPQFWPTGIYVHSGTLDDAERTLSGDIEYLNKPCIIVISKINN